jgi:hypothetical protein
MENCRKKNPKQMARIAESLYAMTAEETVIRLESAPKLNTQIGPMFTKWLRNSFDLLPVKEFRKVTNGIHVMGSSEENGRKFVVDELKQNIKRRPDLIAKVNGKYIIDEAKWISSPGGNQTKQVEEVIEFCKNQKGKVLRLGIIDGFPWSSRKINGSEINDRAAVTVQESPYNIMSALFLKKFLKSIA